MGVTAAIIAGGAALGAAGINYAGQQKAAGAGGSAWNSAQDNLLRKLAQGRYRGGFSADDVFGTRPRAAEYQSLDYMPIDYGAVQLDTIADNYSALPRIENLMGGVNEALRDDSALRIDSFAPGFTGNLRTMTNQATALVGGTLPYSDVMDIVADRQSLGNSLGTPGTFTNATLRDLGMSRLDAMKTGAEMMARIGNLVEQIDPIGQRMRPQESMLTPAETVPLRQADTQFAANYGQKERQLVQASEQNKFLMEAMADPAAQGLFGAEWMARTGSSTPPPMMNWGALIGQAGQSAADIYSAYQKGQQGGGAYGVQGSGQRFSNDTSGWSGRTAYSTYDPTSPAASSTGYVQVRRAEPVY